MPVVVDAGIGAPSDAALAMEQGADACLVNTAIALRTRPGADGGGDRGRRTRGTEVVSGRSHSRAWRTPRPAARSPASSGPPDPVDEGRWVPRLMLVTDARRARMPLLDLVEEAVAGGVDAIYLRDVNGSIEDLALTARTLRARIGDEVVLWSTADPRRRWRPELVFTSASET